MLIKEDKNMTEAERIAVANTNNSYLQALSYVVVGTIFPFAGSEAPDTFMICDGSELDVEEYTDLFNVIGYTFGGSDDTFKLPDLRGRVLVGLDPTVNEFKSIGSIGGEITHALTEKEGPAHSHAASTEKHNGFEYYYQVIADPAASVSTGKFNVEKNSAGQYRIMGANTEATDYLNEKALNSFKTTAEAGKGDAHNNLQPYIVCNYIIKAVNSIPNSINIEYPDMSNKQDKFADLTETDNSRNLKSNKEIKIQYVSDDDERRNSYIELLDTLFRMFGATVEIRSVGGVKIYGNNADGDIDNINVTGNRIRNLAKPIFDADAVNKKYLDEQIGDIETALDEIISIQQGFIGGEA